MGKLVKCFYFILCLLKSLEAVLASENGYYALIDDILQRNVRQNPRSGRLNPSILDDPRALYTDTPPHEIEALDEEFYPDSVTEDTRYAVPSLVPENYRNVGLQEASRLIDLYKKLKTIDRLGHMEGYYGRSLNRETQKRNAVRRNTIFDTFMTQFDALENKDPRSREFNSWGG